MENPSISGCSTFSAASFPALVSRRGCSSVSKTETAPSRPVTRTGTISSANRPSSMARTARSWERSAQASISSRVSPASRAVFQPTRTAMSSLGASGVGAWVGAIQGSCQSSVPGVRRRPTGAVEDECVPPATTARSMPARTPAAAVATLASPEAQ